MPNGKPGDHPFTDIVMHNMEAYGPEIDGLIRDLASHPRFDLDARRRIDHLLGERPPSGATTSPIAISCAASSS